MAADVSSLLQDILTFEEYSNIPEDVRGKIESFLEKQSDERIVAKALLESAKINNEQRFTTLENDVSHWKQEYENVKAKLDASIQQLEVAQKKINTAQNDIAKLKETIIRLEKENADFRHQRDLAVDERNNAVKTIERRTAERDRLQKEVETLSHQLQVAINAKCEALVKADAVEGQEMALNFKEKRMDQERERMLKEIQKLSEELKRQSAELMDLRKENTSGRIILETQLSEKIEELKIAHQTIADLTEANTNMKTKMETSLQKLMAQRENEAKMQETFDNELEANKKLIAVYQEMKEDAQEKNEELQKGIKDLQDLLHKTVEQNDEMETKMKVQEDKYQKILSEKDECIAELKLELQCANEFLKAAKEENVDKAIEELSPAAANICRNLRSGFSITQVFMQYSNVTEELVMLKNENRRLNEYIHTVIEQIEAKAPILKKQREEYECMVENLEKLSKNLEASLNETGEMRKQLLEANKLKEHHERENARLKEQLVDLGKQVCFLLKEVEDLRSNVESNEKQEDMDTSVNGINSSEVISKRLVTFRDIQELQANNQKLLALLREISKKSEEEENVVVVQETVQDLKEVIRVKSNQIDEQKEQILHAQQMLGQALRQVDMYRKILNEHAHHPEDSIELGTTSPASGHQQESKQVAELTAKLQQAEQALKETREDAETYRIERRANDALLTEQLESMRNEMHDMRTKCSKLASQVEYNEERFKIMQANATTYKTQIAALESKNKNYNATVVKHEQSLQYLQNELVESQRKLARAEVSLENSRQEIAVLRDSEMRLQRELEVVGHTQQSQAMLLANVDQIRASLERSEVEGKARMEARLDESLRECGALRRRLQEEQDNFRELSHKLQLETDTAKSRLEEEKKIGARYLEELQQVKEELTKTREELDDIGTRAKDTSPIKKSSVESEMDKLGSKVTELQNQLTLVESELESTKELLKNEKQQFKESCELSEKLEKRLNELSEEYKQYKEMTEKKISTYASTEDQHQKRISALETELSGVVAGSSKSSSQLNVSLTKAREDLKSMQAELDQAKKDLTAARLELSSLSGTVQATEEKYANEVILHSADLQTVTALKAQNSDLIAQITKLTIAKDKAEQALEGGKSAWEEREYLLKAELQETQQRVTNLDAQNEILHKQIEALSSQMAIVHAQVSQAGTESGPDSANRSLNTSINEDETHSSEQLLQIIKYLRREKDVAVSKFDILRTENQRLKSQLEFIKKELEEAKKSLDSKKEESDVSVVTAAKHAELLRKLETLNAVTDSNRILRGERDSLQLQVKDLSARVEELEKELEPLRKEKTELVSRVDSLEAENVALRGEAGRLRHRVNYLIERSSKASLEDVRRMNQERESLAKQVMADKEALNKKEEEARALRQEKTRLEEQVNTLSRQQQQQTEEVRRLSEELSGMQQRLARMTQELAEAKLTATKKHDELAKITEDLGAKEALLTDVRNKEMQIRKIAKKYKTQFEELTKTVEIEKKKQEEKDKVAAEAAANAAAAALEIPPETQEQYREEGRREMDNKHSDRLRELEEQVSSSHEEAETLKKENDSLKLTAAEKEERAKQVLKNARQKIMLLQESKTALTQQLAEVQTRIEAAEQSKEEGTACLTALKNQYESRIARLEKENTDIRADKQREIDTLNSRLVQLQRQLDKLQGAKPSTSSGPVEKVTSDPPTANIKPMAGPTQQSVAVTPWPGRGETPLASIRPMSMQSRTLAVLPTNIHSSSSIISQTSGQLSPILVPPKQQVHTTGSSTGTGSESLSSSPTSSHTDYMPTTSTASGTVRQAAVQPTVTTVSREEPPQSAAESTQDLDTELRGGDNQQLPTASQQQQQQQQKQQPKEQQQPPVQQQQQQQTQQQQQVVAMVLPRMEQQSSPVTVQPAVEQAVAAPSSQASSSSNTVTTTQAGHKRPRDAEGGDAGDDDTGKSTQGKRTRLAAGQQEVFSTVTSDSGLEVEYQVPTSSQRDQEDDVIVVDSDDEVEEGMADDGDLPGYDEGEGAELDEENTADQDNNEVEIMGAEDSSEVPNQSESCATAMMVDSNASVPAEPAQQHSEATSSGTTGGQSEPGSTSTVHSFGRGPSRSVTPLGRQQQQLLLGYEDAGDDSIVPSTPTLFVPRRSDGFGEAVSSPQVPQGRFTFSETNPPTARAGVAQVASEGMDDTRMDLTQLEESGTGRSVPTTPLQVSPQGDTVPVEMSGEVGQSEGGPSESLEEQQDVQAEGSDTPGNIPAITVTEATEEEQGDQMPPPELADVDDQAEHGDSGDQGDQEDMLDVAEEGSDGVSSEGEKIPPAEEMEEGCEAEPSEQSPSKRGTRSGTARRSGRAPFRGRGRGVRPQPIVWNEPGSSMATSSPRGRACLIPSARGSPGEAARGQFPRGAQRGRRMRGKPKGNFPGQYQMRF